MRVPIEVVNRRRERVADLLAERGYLPVAEICRRFGISEATARRDLAALEASRMITRTYGGALAEFNKRFPSFDERRGARASAKADVGRAAAAFAREARCCYFDAGTTVFAVAEAMVAGDATPAVCVTNSIPLGLLLAAREGTEVHFLGGRLLGRQSVIIGEASARALGSWRFDLALLGAEGMDAAGLWNSSPEVVRFQRAILKRATAHAFCVDASKMGRKAPAFLLPWSQLDRMITDAAPGRLAEAGCAVGDGHLVCAGR